MTPTWDFARKGDDAAGRAAKSVTDAFHWPPSDALVTEVTDQLSLKIHRVFLVQHAFRRREAYYVAVSSDEVIASFQSDALPKVLKSEGLLRSANPAAPMLARLFLAFGVVRHAVVIAQPSDIPVAGLNGAQKVSRPALLPTADGWSLTFFSWSPRDKSLVRWVVSIKREGSVSYHEEQVSKTVSSTPSR